MQKPADESVTHANGKARAPRAAKSAAPAVKAPVVKATVVKATAVKRKPASRKAPTAKPKPKAEQPPVDQAMQKADDMIDVAGARVGEFFASLSLTLRKAAVIAKEEAEDLWAEAQSIRRGDTH